MSGNLFPLRLYSLLQALDDAGVLESMQVCENTKQPATRSVKAPDDGLLRILLNSPTVQRQVAKETGERDFRIRISHPNLDCAGFMEQVDKTKLEIYAISGEPLCDPVKLTELADEMANAVQVELLDRLLRARGVDLTRM